MRKRCLDGPRRERLAVLEDEEGGRLRFRPNREIGPQRPLFWRIQSSPSCPRSSWGRRVDLLGQGSKPDPAIAEIGHGCHQVLKGAPEAIEAIHDQRIANGSIGLRPAGRLGEDFVAAILRQSIELQVEGLVAGRDPGVADVHKAEAASQAGVDQLQAFDAFDQSVLSGGYYFVPRLEKRSEPWSWYLPPSA